MAPRLFVPPPRSVYDRAGGGGTEYFGTSSYATYNYLGGGLVGTVKTRHFEVALRLAQALGVKGDVVDFGCADGILLASLDRLYDTVVAVDIRPDFIAIADAVVAELGLSHTTTFCTDGLDWVEVVDKLGPGSKSAVFLLETLEHIGEREAFYESKVEFLQQLSALLRPDGVIMVSVPNMVGLPLLAQRAVLAATRKYREPLSVGELARGVFLHDVSGLEKRWTNIDHLGFNHRLLERALKPSFTIERRRNIGVNVVYALRPIR
ncbi:MAG: class I SAM-dependent methyltransferase [Ilumatobacteraceae bacterium]